MPCRAAGAESEWAKWRIMAFKVRAQGTRALLPVDKSKQINGIAKKAKKAKMKVAKVKK